MTPAEAIGVYLDTLQPLTLEAKATALVRLLNTTADHLAVVWEALEQRRKQDDDTPDYNY